MKLSGMIIVITSVGPVIIVSNETFIDHFDAVRVSIFILFYFILFIKDTRDTAGKDSLWNTYCYL